MDVNDVVLSKAEHPLQSFAELETPCKSSLGSIGVDGLALADPNDVRLVPRARNVGRDDVHLVSVSTRLAREEVYVLANAAQVRIVILRDERDSERARVLNVRHRERRRGHQLQAPSVAELTLQERHELRLSARLVL